MLNEKLNGKALKKTWWHVPIAVFTCRKSKHWLRPVLICGRNCGFAAPSIGNLANIKLNKAEKRLRMHHAEQADELPVTLFEKGWYKFARHVASPNFGARPTGTRIDLMVIHSISLPPGQYGGDEVQQLFTNTLDWDAHPYFDTIRGVEVSAHFYIRRNGELWQFVSCDDRAWHAGRSSFQGRGNCNDFSVGIEMEGLEGHCFELEQYDTLISVGAALQQNYAILNITGHEHIAAGRKADPGAGFDWPKVQRALGNIAGY